MSAVSERRNARQCGRRLALVVSTLGGSWLGMLAVHEFGHVLHAWLSGGTVAGVDLPLAGFSQTHVSPNPHPQFVAWGGAVWGSLLPVAIWAIARRAAPSLGFLAAFFARFCSVANGAYLAAGLFVGGPHDADDAHELLRHSAQTWQLIFFGLVAAAIGVSLWHGLGSSFGLGRAPNAIEGKAVAAAVLMLFCWIAVFLIVAAVGV
ncbi:MAG TPA: hypothetical protein VMV10_29480 [Pirellulales bacterium]|nr:hypothetical protein [Pirellulales bacterium]